MWNPWRLSHSKPATIVERGGEYRGCEDGSIRHSPHPVFFRRRFMVLFIIPKFRAKHGHSCVSRSRSRGESTSSRLGLFGGDGLQVQFEGLLSSRGRKRVHKKIKCAFSCPGANLLPPIDRISVRFLQLGSDDLSIRKPADSNRCTIGARDGQSAAAPPKQERSRQRWSPQFSILPARFSSDE